MCVYTSFQFLELIVISFVLLSQALGLHLLLIHLYFYFQLENEKISTYF